LRVSWVHPSWRDLVIESLAADAALRQRFLAHCGVDVAALALSTAGGADGDRVRPLLQGDADWDALGDGLYRLCAEISEPDAIRLLGVLEDARDDVEVLALDRLVLDRLGWSGRALSVDAICAWTPIAVRLTPRPEPPAVAMTWLELEPHRDPETPVELERFADWLRLAEVLDRHDSELLRGLGFPGRHAECLQRFASRSPGEEPPVERDLRIQSLFRLATLDPSLSRAASEASALMFETARVGYAEWPEDAPRGFPVERVLNDL
jgi:hypothetical protein